MKEKPRRKFLAHCGSLLGAMAFNWQKQALANTTYTPFQRTKLLDKDYKPVTVESIVSGQDYVFHYPYVTTPCFLIDLGKPAKAVSTLQTKSGESYRWGGGIGDNHSIVAFSAICAHRMTHPTQHVSFIAYRSEQSGFYNKNRDFERRTGVIQCCSEQSVYDPAEGGRVLGGPAPQPLAAIQLEVDGKGVIYAVGVTGGMMFDQYFEKFGSRLLLEYQRPDIDAPTGDETQVIAMQEFSKKTMSCG